MKEEQNPCRAHLYRRKKTNENKTHKVAHVVFVNMTISVVFKTCAFFLSSYVRKPFLYSSDLPERRIRLATSDASAATCPISSLLVMTILTSPTKSVFQWDTLPERRNRLATSDASASTCPISSLLVMAIVTSPTKSVFQWDTLRKKNETVLPEFYFFITRRKMSVLLSIGSMCVPVTGTQRLPLSATARAGRTL